MSSMKEIKLGEKFILHLNEHGIPLSFSDDRPYRYGLSNQEMQLNYWGYPISRLDKDYLLRKVSDLITQAQPLDEIKLKRLEERAVSTDALYAAFERQLQQAREACTTGKSTPEIEEARLTQLDQEFHIFLNQES